VVQQLIPIPKVEFSEEIKQLAKNIYDKSGHIGNQDPLHYTPYTLRFEVNRNTPKMSLGKFLEAPDN